MAELPQKEATRTMFIENGFALVAAVIFIYLHSSLNDGSLVTGLLLYGALTVFTVLCVVAMIYKVQYLSKCDDYQRRCHLYALGFGMGMGVIAAMVSHLAVLAGIVIFPGHGFVALAVFMMLAYSFCSVYLHLRAE